MMASLSINKKLHNEEYLNYVSPIIFCASCKRNNLSRAIQVSNMEKLILTTAQDPPQFIFGLLQVVIQIYVPYPTLPTLDICPDLLKIILDTWFP